MFFSSLEFSFYRRGFVSCYIVHNQNLGWYRRVVDSALAAAA